MADVRSASQFPLNIFGGGSAGVSDGVYHTINDSNDAIAIILQARNTNAITGGTIGFRAVATAEDVAVELWDVDASEEPSAVKVGVTVDVTPVANSSVDFTFGSSYTPSAVGELFALVIKASSGWVSGDVDLSRINQIGLGPENGMSQHTSTDGGSTWSKSSSGYRIAAGLESSGRWYHNPLLIPSGDIILTSNTKEKGLKFRPWFGFTAGGFAVSGDMNSNAGDLRVYSDSSGPGNGTIVRNIDAPGNNNDWHWWMFNARQSFSADTDYRITIDPDSGSISTACFEFTDHDRAEQCGIHDGYHDNWHYCEDNGAGGWTDTSTDLVICQFLDVTVDDSGGGGGGGLTDLVNSGLVLA